MKSLLGFYFTTLLLLSAKEVQGCPDNQDPIEAICVLADTFYNITPFDESKVEFLIWTNSNSGDEDYDTVRPFSDEDLARSLFDAKNPTYVIYHGFTEQATMQWINDIKTRVLSIRIANIISVRTGQEEVIIARELMDVTYGPAMCNEYKVGNYTAHAFDWMREKKGLRAADMYLIGYSWGAHIAGVTGHYMLGLSIGKVKRITGLDPAGMSYIELAQFRCMLGKYQADFVDIIHTNGCDIPGNCLGLPDAIGHVDFYPNGGVQQPGCPFILNGICSHYRAVYLFLESITSTKFNSCPCESYDYQANNCISCEQGCLIMGFHLETNLEGTYCLATNAVPPYAQGNVQ